jgi:putative spermidine/putrescine transport system substrate-binding protein
VAAAACSAPATDDKKLPPVDVHAASLAAGFTTMDRLVAAAQREGALTVIGLPQSWVNYGEIIDRFSDEYDIKVTVLQPDANSAQEVAAAHGTPQDPDVFDLSTDVAIANKAKFAPYKVTGWQDIPDDLKDLSGAWYAGYGGYMSIGYDPRKIAAPSSFADLAKPGTTVALPGDPREMASAFDAVMAASLPDRDARRGLKYFAGLKRGGHLSTPDQAAALVDWDYLNAARVTSVDDKPTWQVTIPKGAVLASHYAQAVNKNAPHPAAARLWEEFLFSDAGQNLFLKGLPKVTGTPVTLTMAQQDAAKRYLQSHWSHQMG